MSPKKKPPESPADEHRVVVAECVTMLAEAWNRKISAPMFEAYRIGLFGLDVRSVQSATAAALRTAKMMPSPAELRELAGELRATDRAEKAWIAFDSAISRFGPYKSLSFDDPTINAVVRSLGGLAVVCELPADEYERFVRGRFLKAYESLWRSGVGHDQAAPLLGYFDRVNQESSEPVVVKTGLPVDPRRVGIAASREAARIDTTH
jgi:hypothetical protein